MHEATINEDPGANNVSKAWNNKFAHMVGHQHPPVWKCIKALQFEEPVHRVIAHDAIGNQPRKQVRRAVMEQQRRLRNLCLDYTGGR